MADTSRDWIADGTVSQPTNGDAVVGASGLAAESVCVINSVAIVPRSIPLSVALVSAASLTKVVDFRDVGAALSPGRRCWLVFMGVDDDGDRFALEVAIGFDLVSMPLTICVVVVTLAAWGSGS